MRGVGYLQPTPAGVVEKRLLFVAVVQAYRAVVLLFLFEHFGTVQCPTFGNSTVRPFASPVGRWALSPSLGCRPPSPATSGGHLNLEINCNGFDCIGSLMPSGTCRRSRSN